MNLSPREQQIVNMAREGLTVRQTARLLGIAAGNVSNRRTRLMERFGASRFDEVLNQTMNLFQHSPTDLHLTHKMRRDGFDLYVCADGGVAFEPHDNAVHLGRYQGPGAKQLAVDDLQWFRDQRS